MIIMYVLLYCWYQVSWYALSVTITYSVFPSEWFHSPTDTDQFNIIPWSTWAYYVKERYMVAAELSGNQVKWLFRD